MASRTQKRARRLDAALNTLKGAQRKAGEYNPNTWHTVGTKAYPAAALRQFNKTFGKVMKGKTSGTVASNVKLNADEGQPLSSTTVKTRGGRTITTGTAASMVEHNLGNGIFVTGNEKSLSEAKRSGSYKGTTGNIVKFSNVAFSKKDNKTLGVKPTGKWKFDPALGKHVKVK